MSEQHNDPLENIVYISVPESFTGQVGAVKLDATVLLPVETGGGAESWNPDELTWEMVIAGMLKVLAYQPDHDDAQFYRDFILEMRPRIVEELSETGIINARNEDFILAEEIFRALTGLNPFGVEGPTNLAITFDQRADALEKVGKDDEAEHYRDLATETYRGLVDSDRELPPDVHLNAGLFFLKRYQVVEAQRRLEAFVERSDDEEKLARARAILAEIEMQSTTDRLFRESFESIKSGDEEVGIEKINRFLEEHPEAWNGWFLLGWGRRRLNQFADAAKAFERALTLGGDNADTRNELAICRMELGEFDESRKHLEAALRAEPDNTKIISNLGILALKEENYPEANRFFDSVLALEPDDPVARHYRDRTG
jgi:tetratricopeptide (TPR) repeat protein